MGSMLYAISSSPLGWFGKTPQQLRRGHLATQHPLALLPHLRRYLTALHADGGLRVLHGKCISFVAALAHRKTPRVIREESGACGRIRTGDLLITSELLCQLSHTSILIRVGSSPRSVFSHRAATLQAMWYHTTNPRIRQLLFFTDPQRCRSRYFPRFPAGKYTG